MGDLSRRDVLKLSVAAGAGALLAPTAAAGELLAEPRRGTSGGGRGGEAGRPARLTGRVVRPGDPGYPKARAGWDGLFSSYPLAIVFARNRHDVVNALAWSRQNGVALRVRSGRHSLEGWSNVDGGLVIDVSGLKGARIDAASRTATVGAGLTQGEIVEKLGARNLAVPTGAEATVGISGATLGGGFGFLTRSLGMSCDNLIGAEIVVPAGRDGARVLEVDRRNHPDLLWALRGAGNGNFGIVTSLTYRAHPLREVTFVLAKWKGFGNLHRVFNAWQRSAPVADNRLTSVLEIGTDGIQLYAVLSSGSPQEAERMLAPLLAIGRPDVSVEAGSWVDTFAGFNAGPREFAKWKFFSQFITEPFPAPAIATVGRFMRDAPSAPSNFFCSAFGGAVGRTPRGGSAFPHRDALFYAEPGAGWNGDATTPRAQAWVAEFGQALRPYVDGAYVNVPNLGMADWETAYWGRNFRRLRRIKARYDPHNVFQYEQSIPPATR